MDSDDDDGFEIEDELPVSGAALARPVLEPVETPEYFIEKLIEVRNSTNRKARFFVLFYTQEEGRWEWIPGAPADTDEIYSFELEAGEAVVLAGDGDEEMTAQKIRIWAEADGKTWTQYRDADLYLVPPDATGARRYLGVEMDTFVFDLRN